MYDELVKSIHCCFGFEEPAVTDCENCMMKDKREEYNYEGCCDALGLAAADAIEELSAIREEQKAQIILMAAEIEELKTYAELYQSLTDKSQKTARNLLDAYPKWIPVSERLPEIDEKHHCSKDVLAYLKDGGMCFTALEENIFGQACFECERNPAVEEEMIVPHWMPLPQPPKEET